MAARGSGWPGNAEALHVSFSEVNIKRSLIISQEIDLNGRKVGRGDGNLVSIEYECFLFFI